MGIGQKQGRKTLPPKRIDLELATTVYIAGSTAMAVENEYVCQELILRIGIETMRTITMTVISLCVFFSSALAQSITEIDQCKIKGLYPGMSVLELSTLLNRGGCIDKDAFVSNAAEQYDIIISRINSSNLAMQEKLVILHGEMKEVGEALKKATAQSEQINQKSYCEKELAQRTNQVADFKNYAATHPDGLDQYNNVKNSLAIETAACSKKVAEVMAQGLSTTSNLKAQISDLKKKEHEILGLIKSEEDKLGAIKTNRSSNTMANAKEMFDEQCTNKKLGNISLDSADIQHLFNAKGYNVDDFSVEFSKAYGLKMNRYSAKDSNYQPYSYYQYKDGDIGCEITISGSPYNNEPVNLTINRIDKKTKATF